MTFRVIPGDLAAYAGQIGRAADDSHEIKRYLDGYTVHEGWNGLLIELAGPSSTDALHASIETCQRVTDVLRGSVTGLTGTADYYRATDTAAAARIDATLTGLCVARTALEDLWAANPCQPGFSDSREPYTRLKPVGEVEYNHPLGFLDNISMTHWALVACDKILGVDPLEKTLEFFLGDWQSVARAGLAIRNAADALDDLAYNVQGGAVAVNRTWDGMAGESAYQHFTKLAADLQRLAAPMREIARQLEEISHGVWSTCEAVSGILKGLGDAALVAGIAIVGGTLTAETGIGAVVGYGVAALEVYEILDMWAQATKAMNNIYAAVQSSVGFIEAQASALRQTALPRIAADGPYRHPFAPAN